jgi:hypothetical protein
LKKRKSKKFKPIERENENDIETGISDLMEESILVQKVNDDDETNNLSENLEIFKKEKRKKKQSSKMAEWEELLKEYPDLNENYEINLDLMEKKKRKRENFDLGEWSL